jgi:hypothetical protein
MPGQNLVFFDPLIGEETVGGLGIRPVLARERDAFPDTFRQVPRQLAKPLVEPFILKLATGKFLIKPSRGP